MMCWYNGSTTTGSQNSIWYFNIEDAPCPGRSVETDGEEIKVLIEVNYRRTTREIATSLSSSNLTVYDPVKSLGIVSKLGVAHVFEESH